ncbi:MAG: ferrous iron transport protein A [Succinivibrio sp.]
MNTLDRLKPGESATVSNVAGDSGSLRRRLLDMGITPDTKITMLRSAPLGDPLEIKVRDYSLTLRRDDASLVEIR